MMKVRNGFTIIEAILAMLVVGVVSIISLQYLSVYQKNCIVKSNTSLIATALGRDTMERFYWEPYCSFGVDDTYNDPLPSSGPYNELANNYNGRRSYAITHRNDYVVLETTVGWNI